MIIVKDKAKNSKIYIQRTGGDIIPTTNTNTDVDLSDYYTKEEVDELLANVGEDIPYYIVSNENGNYTGIGDIDGVWFAYENNKPFMIFVPFGNSGNLIQLTSFSMLSADKYGEDYLVGIGYMYNGDDLSYLRCTFSRRGYNGSSSSTKAFYAKSEIDRKITDIQEWVEQQGYLTSIPDNVVTEDELEDVLNDIDYSLPTITVYQDDSSIEGDIEGVINAIINSEDCNVLYKTGNTIHKSTGFYTTSSNTSVRAYFYYLSDNRMARRHIDITKNTPYTATISSLTFPNIPVDNLTSNSKVMPLSANQGRVLDERITNEIGNINNILENIIG